MIEFSTEGPKTTCPCCGPIWVGLTFWPAFHFTCPHGQGRLWVSQLKGSQLVVFKSCEPCAIPYATCPTCKGNGTMSSLPVLFLTESSGFLSATPLRLDTTVTV